MVGNPSTMETFEIALVGPQILFKATAIISICGATFPIFVENEEKSMWSRFVIRSGQTLRIGKVTGPGIRCYLAIKGGFPEM